jgi:hypothetical protein
MKKMMQCFDLIKGGQGLKQLKGASLKREISVAERSKMIMIAEDADSEEEDERKAEKKSEGEEKKAEEEKEAGEDGETDPKDGGKQSDVDKIIMLSTKGGA